MNHFSEEARGQISTLVNSNLYLRAKQSVIDGVEINVIGSNRSADQTALDLAVKEGVQLAFRELEYLALPQIEKHNTITPRTVQKHKQK